MGFGGSAAAMINSIKSNRSLVKGRDHLFDRPVTRRSAPGGRAPGRAATPPAIRRKFQQQLAREKREVYRKWWLTLAITLGLAALLWACSDHLLHLF